MRGRFLFLAAVAALLTGCGGTSTPATTTSGTTTAAQVALKVYFYRGNALLPVVVHVPQTQAVATAALTRLLAGPPPGYRTGLPTPAALQSVAVANGTATVHIRPDTIDREGEAQIVYTLTQFPTVMSVDGSTRAGFADLTPLAPIFVAAPQRYSTVSSPVHASGTADVFEGSLAVDISSNGRLLRTQTITATSGTGTRGTWSATFNLPPGPAELIFYEPSAENGTHLHSTELDVTVQ